MEQDDLLAEAAVQGCGADRGVLGNRSSRGAQAVGVDRPEANLRRHVRGDARLRALCHPGCVILEVHLGDHGEVSVDLVRRSARGREISGRDEDPATGRHHPSGGEWAVHQRVVVLAMAGLCALAPGAAMAQMGTGMGPGMMGGPPAGGSGSSSREAPAQAPRREAPEGTSRPAAPAQMTEPMGHQAVREPFYRESAFLVLLSLAIGAGAIASYHLVRARRRRSRGGAVFVTEAVLVVDLVQSTHLATHYGDGVAMKARTILKDRTLAIASDHGLVFAENTGDGYFMTFESVAGAIHTAFALLADLKAHPADVGPAPPLAVRIGITYGEILLDAGGVRHGAVINKAFRLESLSREAFVQIEGHGETAEIPECDRVFLGEDAAEEARAHGFSPTLVGICTLKGFSGLHRVYQAVA
jgi:class 3 adenylate cyclase